MVEASSAGKTAIIRRCGGDQGRRVPRLRPGMGGVFIVGVSDDREQLEMVAQGDHHRHERLEPARWPSSTPSHAAAVDDARGEAVVAKLRRPRRRYVKPSTSQDARVQGTPLVDMSTDDVLRAVVTGLQTNFVTARAAARQMIEQGGGGVILHLNSASGAGSMPRHG